MKMKKKVKTWKMSFFFKIKKKICIQAYGPGEVGSNNKNRHGRQANFDFMALLT